ncbi:50S ribosomal protein L2 [Abditibacteriota bacterium]|nr:50S ribosomal protein L2 [Abditibacteriota bacterium]
MPIKNYNPTSPARRSMTKVVNPDLSDKRPEKSLTEPLKKTAGRNNQGRLTARNKGGGHKRLYRIVDFKRRTDGVSGEVTHLEYDPNRSANIALIQNSDGTKRYIIAPAGLKVGDKVMDGPTAEIRVGNALPLQNIPVGTTIHNVELQPGRGAQLGRSAGTAITLQAKEGKFALILLPSRETRLVQLSCRATIGAVGNAEWENIVWGNAGRSRHRGIAPHTRGKAMNPNDHPHGGGEGRASVGRRKSGPVSATGVKAIGFKTRKSKKPSDKMIVSKRKK